MIVSKPKTGTLFSLGAFIAICAAGAIYGATEVYGNNAPAWYHLALLFILGPIGLGILAKTIVGYQTVTIGKEKIDIHFPVQFKTKHFSISNIDYWKENTVKTATGTFKEVEIKFIDNRKRLHLSYQEHTEYQKIIQYLRKKCSKKIKK